MTKTRRHMSGGFSYQAAEDCPPFFRPSSNRFVSATTTPERNKSPIKFGMAMRPWNTSKINSSSSSSHRVPRLKYKGHEKIMNGTKSPTTFPIDLTPPKMTNAVIAIMTIPVTTIGTLNELFKARLLMEQQAKRDLAATGSRCGSLLAPRKASRT